MIYDVFLLKPVMLSMWWSRALLKKVNKVNNVKVNTKTYYVTYGVTRNFNLKDHNIIKKVKKKNKILK